MKGFQKAMFKAYWFPLALFYGFPCIVLSIANRPIKIIEFLEFFLPFPLVIFLTGYFLAPLFGPRVASNKAWSFIMAFICLFLALFSCILIFTAPDDELADFGVFLATLLATFALFPTLLAGILFIGACENIARGNPKQARTDTQITTK